MVSTDLLITWSKNNIHDGYNFFSLLEIQWVNRKSKKGNPKTSL